MNITLDEIRSNAPDGATHYLVLNHTYYLKYYKDIDRWLAWYDYDCHSEWGIANHRAVRFNLQDIKPL